MGNIGHFSTVENARAIGIFSINLLSLGREMLTHTKCEAWT